MSIQVTSSTDTPEQVLADIGSKQAAKVEGKKSAPALTEQGENAEESDASEEIESEIDSESEDDESLKDEDQYKPKKKSGFKKRIDKLNQKLSAKDQEIEHWRSEALKQKPIQENQQKETQSKVVEARGKPKPEDFVTYEEYDDARTDWKLEQKEKEREAKQKETQVKTEYQKQVESFRAKVAEFKETIEDEDDFEEVRSYIVKTGMSPALDEAVMSSDIGPQVLYELGKNQDEYERVNRLGFAAVIREVAKIEARLSKSSETPKEIKQTKAPPPINPVGGGSASVGKSLNDPNISFAEYERQRMQQLKNKK